MPLDTETPHQQQSLRLDPKGNRLTQGELDLGDQTDGSVVPLPCDIADLPCDTEPHRDGQHDSQVTDKEDWTEDRSDGPEDDR